VKKEKKRGNTVRAKARAGRGTSARMQRTKDESALFTNVGANVRAARLAAGLTQRELAEKAGVNRFTVSDIERGEVNFSLRILVDLANVMGVSPIDLLRGI
jgi:DNA-binding XRE family transcriptional regulator